MAGLGSWGLVVISVGDVLAVHPHITQKRHPTSAGGMVCWLLPLSIGQPWHKGREWVRRHSPSPPTLQCTWDHFCLWKNRN